MKSFVRPQKPPRFDSDVQSERNTIADSVKNGLRPSFPDKWGKYKYVLSRCQRHKCAYCERDTISVAHGDVEHYAPKAEVCELDPDPRNWGKEGADISNVSGRVFQVLCNSGYWWLAYEWSNYLLSCSHCNQKWKKNLFPVLENPRQLPPSEHFRENPLLLNPFNRRRIEYLFKYTKEGIVEPVNGDIHAQATIDICGLNRTSLVFVRSKHAFDAHTMIERVLRLINEGNEALAKEIAEDILRKGALDREHCGMVRSIWKQHSGLDWIHLESLAKL